MVIKVAMQMSGAGFDFLFRFRETAVLELISDSAEKEFKKSGV